MRDPYLDFENAPEGYVIRIYGMHGVPSLWADEVGYNNILEFLGLCAKTYALGFADGGFIMKNKGGCTIGNNEQYQG